jgi:hypothetical protein
MKDYNFYRTCSLRLLLTCIIPLTPLYLKHIRDDQIPIPLATSPYIVFLPTPLTSFSPVMLEFSPP